MSIWGLKFELKVQKSINYTSRREVNDESTTLNACLQTKILALVYHYFLTAITSANVKKKVARQRRRDSRNRVFSPGAVALQVRDRVTLKGARLKARNENCATWPCNQRNDRIIAAWAKLIARSPEIIPATYDSSIGYASQDLLIVAGN